MERRPIPERSVDAHRHLVKLWGQLVDLCAPQEIKEQIWWAAHQGLEAGVKSVAAALHSAGADFTAMEILAGEWTPARLELCIEKDGDRIAALREAENLKSRLSTAEHEIEQLKRRIEQIGG